MKKLISAVLAAVLVFSLCGCTIKPEKSDITVGVLDELHSFSPGIASGDAEALTAVNCYEGLMRYNEDGSVSPAGAIAYSVTSDGLVYTFRLNPSAVWYISDGARSLLNGAGINPDKFDSRVTSADYVASLLRALKEKLPDYERLLCIKGAEEYAMGKCTEEAVGLKGEDDTTLIITLGKPCSDILTALALPVALPESAAFRAAAGESYAQSPSSSVFNGPYYAESLSATGTVILRRNPDYKGIANTLNNGLTLYLTGKKGVLETRFNNGVYDIYRSKTLENAPEDSNAFACGSRIWGMAFNCSSEYIADPNLRLALACDTDFESIKKPDFAKSEAEELIPPNFTAGDRCFFEIEEGFGKQFDLQNAVIYFIKSDAMKYAPIELKVSVPREYENTFKKICAQWEADFPEIIKTTLTLFDKDDAEKIREEGNYDIAVLPLAPDYTTAVSALESVKKAPCLFSSEKLDSLLGKASAASAGEITDIIYETQAHIINTAVFIPLFETREFIYTSNAVSGFYASESGELLYFNGAEK